MMKKEIDKKTALTFKGNMIKDSVGNKLTLLIWNNLFQFLIQFHFCNKNGIDSKFDANG